MGEREEMLAEAAATAERIKNARADAVAKVGTARSMFLVTVQPDGNVTYCEILQGGPADVLAQESWFYKNVSLLRNRIGTP